MEWQDAVAVAMGAKKANTVERRKAWQMLHDTGIGYKLGNGLADIIRNAVATGAIKGGTDEQQPDRK